MARKAIIELAKDKGMTEFVPIGSNALWEQIEKFVDFAVEEEREACATLVEREWSTNQEKALCDELASYIRARGQT